MDDSQRSWEPWPLPFGIESELKMTVEELKSQTRKDLAGMAKTRGVAGWHAMRKDELVKALSKLVRKDRRSNNGRRASRSRTNGQSPSVRNGTSKRSSNGKAKADKQVHNGAQKRRSAPLLKNLASENGKSTGKRDRLFVVAHDSYWLHALWELRSSTVKRAEAGLGIEWHSAKPVIRVLDVSSDENRRSVEQVVQDVEIHGGINHWYIQVDDPPGVYQLQIGYLTESGRFFGLVRSNIVKTPLPGTQGVADESWNEAGDGPRSMNGRGGSRRQANGDMHQLIDQKSKRPLSEHPLTNFLPVGSENGHDEIRLELDAELVLYGSVNSGARLTIGGKPLDLSEDGSFTIRWNLQEGRQVIPAAVTSPSGAKQQTVVLAIERNTKHLETQHFDGCDA